MGLKIAIDFGTSNTRVAVWDEADKTGKPLFIPAISAQNIIRTEGSEISSFCIPSLIHYKDNEILIGDAVIKNGLGTSTSTFKWLKRYISNRMELPRNINEKRISYVQAGIDFLNELFNYISATVNTEDAEYVFTVPVDTYEHYQEWLTQVCENAGINRWRLLDESSAVALGYGVNIQANDIYLIFDFGAGTLDTSVVKIESAPEGGKRCRVLGKSGTEIGGCNIDNWLYKNAAETNNLYVEDIRHISMPLLSEIEKAKLSLSYNEKAGISVTDHNTGDVITADWSRSGFEDLLEEHGFYHTIQRSIDQSLNEARERGILKEHIKAVLLTGGSSLIPSVKKMLTRQFGNIVHYHRPLDATVIGAAAFAGGVDFYDHIHHDYALRYYNAEKKDYDFEIIVEAGTTYPSKGSVKELTIKAAFDNQSALGIDVYEINRKHICNENAPLDLVFDPGGGARFTKKQDAKILSSFHLNEKSPTFINAQPPAMKDDARFPTKFSIDGNKRLCISVFDNLTRKPLMMDHPVVRLT